MEYPQSDNKVYSLSFGSPDRDHFFRRTCPSCGRDFKTEIDESDLQWPVAPEIRRIGLDPGAKQEGIETDPETEIYLHCPYCEHRAEVGNTLTEEHGRFLNRHLMREVLLRTVNDMFSGLENIGRRSGGLVRFENHRSPQPPRPILGPDPPDMKIIEFLCCNRKAKVAERWYMVSKCIYCGSPVTLI